MKKIEFRQLIRGLVKEVLTETALADVAAFEDAFDLDQSTGGVDHSLDKIHRQLMKLQTEMNKLMVKWKAGEITNEEYFKVRKPLQAKRNSLEAKLTQFNTDEEL